MDDDSGWIVVAHRIPAEVTPLAGWLADAADRITLITSTASAPGYEGAFAEVIAVDDYSGGTGVDEHLDRLCRTRPVRRIVHGTEDDLLRIAKVRDRYGVAGLGERDALAYRDKLVMKNAVAGSVSTPACLAPRDFDEAVGFAERYGWPVVVKPRRGYGSKDVVLVRSAPALRAEVADRPADDVLLEEFITGPVHHVDGFMRDGEVLVACASRYLNNCLAWHENRPLGSIQLDDDDPLNAALEAFTATVVKTLPATDLSPFHLEVFAREPDGELYFCEIGARLGGAHVLETLTYTTGVNPVELWFRHQAGLPVDGAELRRGTDRFGWLLMPPRTGTLESVEGSPLPGYVRNYYHPTDLPRTFDGAHTSTDAALAFVVEGSSSREVEQHLQECITWASEAMTWGN